MASRRPRPWIEVGQFFSASRLIQSPICGLHRRGVGRILDVFEDDFVEQHRTGLRSLARRPRPRARLRVESSRRRKTIHDERSCASAPPSASCAPGERALVSRYSRTVELSQFEKSAMKSSSAERKANAQG